MGSPPLPVGEAGCIPLHNPQMGMSGLSAQIVELEHFVLILWEGEALLGCLMVSIAQKAPAAAVTQSATVSLSSPYFGGHWSILA